ncbi:MAG: sigma-54 dependent transcriptional regulator [Thermodesulfovibrionales bacterium]|nr:sigma-54 dependent transcriptional regulator [Thermodesulfovibrionales bacterium]
MSENRILLIDDDEAVVWVVKKALEPMGYEIRAENTIEKGKKALEGYSLILLDMVLPDGNGIDLLREIKQKYPETLVIIITAHGRMESAINAMKEGAYDYLEKPFDIEELMIVVKRAFTDISIRKELTRLRDKVEDGRPVHILGKSKAMLKVFKEIGKVATRDVIVLITGESGTGKELVARAIHNNSLRKFNPFVAINCASIPKDLLEAELFGFEKGAFTGALDKRIGKIQSASGGTLFLDELSELDINLQAKLLRFIQENEFSPIGSDKTIKGDVRIIGATNKDLKSCVKNGTFREDLYYRFNVIEITLPPLRERREDITLLARHFLEQAIKLFDLPPKDFSKHAIRALFEYDWPGNVRELENLVKRAAILSKSSLIEKKDIFYDEHKCISIKDFLENRLESYITKMSKINNANLYDTVINEVEKALLSIVINKTQGNQLQASKILGINRNTLNKKLKAYKIDFKKIDN